jgi:hypothetical protein
MTNTKYKEAMKAAKKEYNQWLKDNKMARALVKKEAAKIRKATLTARAKVAKKKVKVVKKKVTKKATKKKVARKKK